MLSMPSGCGLQLAVLRCGVRFAHRIQGYLHSLQPSNSEPLLRGPLMVWDEDEEVDADALSDAFNRLIDYLRASNPIVQRYLTVAEQDFGEARQQGEYTAPGAPLSDSTAADAAGAVPCVHASAYGDSVAATQARDPRSSAPDSGGNCTLTAAMDWDGQWEADARPRRPMFKIGEVVPRADQVTIILPADGAPKPCDSCQCCPET